MSKAAQALFDRHSKVLRDPAQVAGAGAPPPDPRQLRWTETGDFWGTLARAGVTVLLTREYEHLVLALSVKPGGRPRQSHLSLPHPSGLAVDRRRGRVHVAATRNPNIVFDLEPLGRLLEREDDPGARRVPARPLWPVRARYYPGSCYFHDLAVVGGRLHANAVGHNAVVRLDETGGFRPVWWPKSIERGGKPRFGRNWLQLNSIAAGASLAASYFSASTERPGRHRPGQLAFKVDRQGVLFDGKGGVHARGLTRPHSARLHGGRVWVDNSGYGELGYADGGRFRPHLALPGWTRGLAFCGKLALVGTSRVIPRFAAYAPGLDVGRSRCGLHWVDLQAGRILGSLFWPWGNQIFAVETLPRAQSLGFAQETGHSDADGLRRLAYGYAAD